MYITDDLGAGSTPTSVWTVGYSMTQTIVQMPCFVSYRLVLVDLPALS